MARFINPNLHVILIHYPMALLTAGLLIEIFAFLWRTSSFRTAGRWMILLGALSLLPAATSGIYALRDVAAHGADGNELSWLQTKQEANLSPEEWHFLRNHVLFNAIGAVIALVAVVTWIASSDLWRRRLHVPGVVVLVIAMGLISAGAWHGGEMVYRFGIGVKDRGAVIQESIIPDRQLDAQEKIDKYLSPMQTHIVMAGIVFAIAAAALGLTLRGAMQARSLLVERKPIEQAAADIADSGSLSESEVRPISIQPLPENSAIATVVSSVPPRVPSSRFWVLAAVLAIITILGGFWVGGFFVHPDQFGSRLHRTFFEKFSDPAGRRMAMHIIFGSSILVLTLVLAILARTAPRSRGLLGTFAALLVLVMAAQLWMGILLLYDSDRGPLTRFQSAVPERTMQPTTCVGGSVSMAD